MIDALFNDPNYLAAKKSLDAVALLIEMTADDRALQNRPPKELAKALLRFATAPSAAAPSCALSALPEGGPVMARVQRLLNPAPGSVWTRSAALASAARLKSGTRFGSAVA